jgi:hypothetical protein
MSILSNIMTQLATLTFAFLRIENNLTQVRKAVGKLFYKQAARSHPYQQFARAQVSATWTCSIIRYWQRFNCSIFAHALVFAICTCSIICSLHVVNYLLIVRGQLFADCTWSIICSLHVFNYLLIARGQLFACVIVHVNH